MAFAFAQKSKKPAPLQTKRGRTKTQTATPKHVEQSYGAGVMGFGLPVSAAGGVPVIQAKLKIGEPNDQYEKEADQVADQVMRMSEPASGADDDTILQAKPLANQITSLMQRTEEVGGVGGISPNVQFDIQATRGGGRTMDSETRGAMQSGFGRDFSGVRIHDGENADRLASSLGARAFTVGNDVFFGRAEYQPEEPEGERLLAHELVHTVQQGEDSEVRRQVVQREGREGGDGGGDKDLRIPPNISQDAWLNEPRFGSIFYGKKMISKGSIGNAVKLLQRALMNWAYDNYSPPLRVLTEYGDDGKFGPESYDALVIFQKANGLAPDGIFGPNSLEVMESYVLGGKRHGGTGDPEAEEVSPDSAFFDPTMIPEVVPDGGGATGGGAAGGKVKLAEVQPLPSELNPVFADKLHTVELTPKTGGAVVVFPLMRFSGIATGGELVLGAYVKAAQMMLSKKGSGDKEGTPLGMAEIIEGTKKLESAGAVWQQALPEDLKTLEEQGKKNAKIWIDIVALERLAMLTGAELNEEGQEVKEDLIFAHFVERSLMIAERDLSVSIAESFDMESLSDKGLAPNLIFSALRSPYHRRFMAVKLMNSWRSAPLRTLFVSDEGFKSGAEFPGVGDLIIIPPVKWAGMLEFAGNELKQEIERVEQEKKKQAEDEARKKYLREEELSVGDAASFVLENYDPNSKVSIHLRGPLGTVNVNGGQRISGGGKTIFVLRASVSGILYQDEKSGSFYYQSIAGFGEGYFQFSALEQALKNIIVMELKGVVMDVMMAIFPPGKHAVWATQVLGLYAALVAEGEKVERLFEAGQAVFTDVQWLRDHAAADVILEAIVKGSLALGMSIDYIDIIFGLRSRQTSKQLVEFALKTALGIVKGGSGKLFAGKLATVWQKIMFFAMQSALVLGKSILFHLKTADKSVANAALITKEMVEAFGEAMNRDLGMDKSDAIELGWKIGNLLASKALREQLPGRVKSLASNLKFMGVVGKDLFEAIKKSQI